MSPEGGLIAIKTRLGWVIYGLTEGLNTNKTSRIMHIRLCDEEIQYLENFNTMMKSYFDIENFGIKLDAPKIIPKNFKNTTRRVGDRYESGLL